MKRIAASVGIVALGATGLQAADTAGLSANQTTKPWNVSATLRGFYDDNINTAPSGPNKQDAFGFEISPSVGVGFAGEQTSGSASYTYSGKFYDHRPNGSTDKWDHTHIFDAGLHHSFTPQMQIAVKDSFVIGQEPDVLRAGDTYSSYQRIEGDNMRNHATIVFNAEVTRLLGFEVGYANAWYDYDNEGATLAGPAAVVIPSNSGLLDRMEHLVHVDSRWHLLPQTTGIFGYMYGQTDYSADELVSGSTVVGDRYVTSDERDSRSHYLYAGVEHNFSPELSASLKLGGQYTEFPNDNGPTDESGWSPYLMATLRYFYAIESSLDVGVIHNRSTTDLIGQSTAAPNSFVHDQEVTTAYASLRHRIIPNLYGSLTGTYQYSTQQGGSFDDENDQFYLFGVNLEYRFNTHISTHIGYNYDRLDSDIPGRDFTRNRVYIGLTAAY